MALDRPADDIGMFAERIVKPSKSVELFHAIIEDLLEDGDLQVRDDANFILGKLNGGEVGIVCEDGMEVGEICEEKILITQAKIGNTFLPLFIISPSLNAPDLFDYIHRPSFLGIKPSREHMRPTVLNAVSQMAFALRSAERLGVDKPKIKPDEQ